MQGRQFPTTFRHFQPNRTPFLKKMSGVRIRHYFLSVSEAQFENLGELVKNTIFVA